VQQLDKAPAHVVEHRGAFSGVARVASPAAPAGLMSCICQPSLPLGVIERNLFSSASCSVRELKFWN
jgi:hypothetical protein